MIRQSAGKEIWLAYLMGVYLGDGCLYQAQSSLRFSMSSIDYDFVEKVIMALDKVIGKKPNIWETKDMRWKTHKPQYYTSCNANEIGWFKEATNQKEKVPEFIINASREEQIAFISGLLDSEGYVATTITHPGTITIGLKAAGKWMIDLYKMCQRLGVKIGKVGNELLPSGKIAHRFHFNSRSFIENGLYFNLKRKQNRLDKWRFNPQRSYAGQWTTVDDMIRSRQRCREVGRNDQLPQEDLGCNT